MEIKLKNYEEETMKRIRYFQTSVFLVVLVMFFLSMATITYCAKVELTWWARDYLLPVAKLIAEEFEKANPDIEVKIVGTQHSGLVERFIINIKAGNPPDLADVGTPPTALISRGYLLDITDMVQESMPMEDFVESALALYSRGGRIYGMPYRVEAQGLYWNKNMFKEAGLEGPPTTLDEFITDAQKLTIDKTGDGVIDQWGYVLNLAGQEATGWWWVFPIMENLGRKVVNLETGEVHIDSPEGIAMFKYLNDLINKYKVVSSESIAYGWTETQDIFIRGISAMARQIPQFLDKLELEAPDLNIAIAPFPTWPNSDKKYGAASLGGYGFGIPYNANHPKEAFKLMKYILTTDKWAVQYTTTLPSRISLREDPKFKRYKSEDYAWAIKGLDYAFVPVENIPEVFDPLHLAVHKVILGIWTPEKAAQWAQQEIELNLKESGY